LPEEDEKEGEGEGRSEGEDGDEDGDGDERKEGDEGEEEGEEADEEEEDEEPTNRDGTQCTYHRSLALTPSRSSRLKITLKQPTQTHKRSRAPRAVHEDKDLDSDIEPEVDDEDDHPRDGVGKRPPTTRQVALASVVGSPHVSLGGFMFL
jgi:hypothetical protein